MKILSLKNKRRLRRVLESRSTIVTPMEARKLRFYQIKPTTADFFFKTLGHTNVTIEDTPHYQLALSLANDKHVSESEAFYIDYLHASWGKEKTHLFNGRIDAFKAHFKAFAAGAKAPRPALTFLSDLSPAFVLDGNHRTSFAAALQRDQKCEILPPDLALLLYSNAKEFYGTGYREMPYQSVYLNDAIIVEGRRNDALERIRLIPPHILKNKTILDVASNIGMSSLLARSEGAASCLGLELSAGMVDLATRFSTFDGKYPHVSFARFNVDEDILPPTIVYDTAFMFSIHDHLKRPDRLLEIARTNVRSYVVFEGHPGASREKYSRFFDSGMFKDVTEIGQLDESRFNSASGRRRPLWICTKHGQ